MKKLIVLIFIFFNFSCSNKEEVVLYSPFDLESRTFVIIDLDKTNLNFKQITDIVHKLSQQDSLVSIEFIEGKKRKRIIPISTHRGCYWYRNILEVVKKGANKEFHNQINISELNTIHEEFSLNYGKNRDYSDSPNKAIVQVSLDSLNSANDLKAMLSKITKSFDSFKTKDKNLNLMINFNYWKRFPIPPNLD